MVSVGEVARVILVGGGATVLMDIWAAILKRFGIATLDYGLVGRWAGHLGRGRFAHTRIVDAAPVRHERALGWAIHYAVGIAFAALLIGIEGMEWLRTPTVWPALALGTATVVFPWLVMQPAMGFGWAASRTPTPLRNGVRSLVTHAVWGGGLYLSAVALKYLWA